MHNDEIKRNYDQEVERYFRLLDHIENCRLWIEQDKYNGYRKEKADIMHQLESTIEGIGRVKQRLSQIDGLRKVPMEIDLTINEMKMDLKQLT